MSEIKQSYERFSGQSNLRAFWRTDDLHPTNRSVGHRQRLYFRLHPGDAGQTWAQLQSEQQLHRQHCQLELQRRPNFGGASDKQPKYSCGLYFLESHRQFLRLWPMGELRELPAESLALFLRHEAQLCDQLRLVDT